MQVRITERGKGGYQLEKDIVLCCGGNPHPVRLRYHHQPAGFTGGYKDFQLSKAQYYVYFGSNGYTSPQTTYEFFLTRAADIALSRGYPDFYVLQSQNVSMTQTYVTPGEATTTVQSSTYGTYNNYGRTGYLNASTYGIATTTYTPPQIHQINRPGFQGEILLVNGKIKSNAPEPFSANVIYQQGMDLKKQVDTHNTVVTVVIVALTLVGGAAIVYASSTNP